MDNKKYKLQISDIYLKKCYSSIYFIAIISVITLAAYYFYPKWYLFASLAVYVLSELIEIKKNRDKYLRYKILAEKK